MKNIWVMQDGADFYVYDSAEMENLTLTRTYPYAVDDMPAARKARVWFESLCSRQTRINWVGGSIGVKVAVTTLTLAGPDAVEVDGAGMTCESYKSIDWSNASDKTWLMNHLHWAMNNGRPVTITPESN